MAKGPIWTHMTIAASSLDYRSKASCFSLVWGLRLWQCQTGTLIWSISFASSPHVFARRRAHSPFQPFKTSNRFWTKGSTKVTPRSNLCGTEVIVLNTICGLAFGQFWPQLFYKPEAADWMKGLPWIASAMVFLLLFIWISLLVSFCNNAAQKPESDCGEDCAGFIYHQL